MLKDFVQNYQPASIDTSTSKWVRQAGCTNTRMFFCLFVCFCLFLFGCCWVVVVVLDVCCCCFLGRGFGGFLVCLFVCLFCLLSLGACRTNASLWFVSHICQRRITWQTDPTFVRIHHNLTVFLKLSFPLCLPEWPRILANKTNISLRQALSAG